jgi:predicted negative regulator of RcsB-dependent stress response
MKPEKRISKKTMKEDRLVSTTFKATEYIQKNQTPFIIGAIAIVAIFSLVMLFKWNTDKKKVDGASILSRAEMTGAMGQMDQYLADLQLLSDNYSGTAAGKIATLRLANNNFDAKKYDNAEKYFDKILDRYSDDKMLAASAAAGKGACLELKSNYAEAAKFYRRAAEFKSGDLWTPNYLLKAGQDFMKSGDKKSAQAAFDEIEKKYANTSESNSARRALAELKY